MNAIPREMFQPDQSAKQTPLANPPQGWVAKAADHLAEDIDEDAGRGNRDLR